MKEYQLNLVQSLFAFNFTSFGHFKYGISSRRWTGSILYMFGSISILTFLMKRDPLSFMFAKSYIPYHIFTNIMNFRVENNSMDDTVKYGCFYRLLTKQQGPLLKIKLKGYQVNKSKRRNKNMCNTNMTKSYQLFVRIELLLLPVYFCDH